MPDPNRLPQSSATKGPNQYPNEEHPATHSLRSMIRERIESSGPMRFADFMAMALYEPQHGYYAKDSRQVGKDGDFFTSVSVGPVFGQLLARRFLKDWDDIGQPEKWRIIECGAHDGKLATDILGELQTLNPKALKALEYVIPEPLSELQAAQKQRLGIFADHARHVIDLAELKSQPLPGIAFGNELLDALPCHMVEFRDGEWKECRVNASDTQLIWELHPIDDPELNKAVQALGKSFPDGYRTEVRTNFASVMQPLAECLENAAMIWIDYGFAREDYYHPDRISGTLRTFSGHQADEDPLSHPGQMDITAHVDFTAVKEAAESIGGNATLFRSQGAWLTELAREWLLSMEGQPQPSFMRQFQTLTHPAQLGSRFHVLELSWRQSAPTAANGL